jgi:hypothetical protein
MFDYCTVNKRKAGFGHRQIPGNLVKQRVRYTVAAEFVTGLILLRGTISLRQSTFNSISTHFGTFYFRKCEARNLCSKKRFRQNGTTCHATRIAGRAYYRNHYKKRMRHSYSVKEEFYTARNMCVIRQLFKKTKNILLIAEDLVKLDIGLTLVTTASKTCFSARCCRVFATRFYLIPFSFFVPCFTSVLLTCVTGIKNEIKNWRDDVEANVPVTYLTSIAELYVTCTVHF